MMQVSESSGRRRRWLAAVLGSLLVCSPAMAADTGCEAQALRAGQSIAANRLASWEPVGDRALLVWTLHDGRAHLVGLDHQVAGLRHAATVFLTTRGRDGIVCACGHDGLLLPNGKGARIVFIRYLSKERTAPLDAAGEGAPRTRATPT